MQHPRTHIGALIFPAGGDNKPPFLWYVEPTVTDVVNAAKVLIEARKERETLRVSRHYQMEAHRERYNEIKRYCEKLLAGAKTSQVIRELRVPDEVVFLEKELSVSDNDKLAFIMEKMYQKKKKEEFEQGKLLWAAAYGSKHLALAVEKGYDCEPLYVQERITREFPGYEILEGGIWIRHPNPSPAALWEAIGVNGEVALMHRDKGDGVQEEVVIIREYLGKYMLVKSASGEIGKAAKPISSDFQFILLKNRKGMDSI